MAIDMRDRGTVGCSYYVAEEEKLFFMEDLKLGSIETIAQCQFWHQCHGVLTDGPQ